MTDLLSNRGVYDTRRASALSGIPVSTLHYWARTDLVAPSISSEPRLWSWVDLLTIRAVDWVRKRDPSRTKPSVSVRRLRKDLASAYEAGLKQHDLHDSLRISHAGRIFFHWRGKVFSAADLQIADEDVLDLVAPYQAGPDLLRPRFHLRIIPGKLGGEPHVEGTRITTPALFALHRDGYSDDQILRMYRGLTAAALRDACDLERSLIAA